MAALRFLLALATALAAHAAVAAISPAATRAVDPLLLVVVFQALGHGALGGLLGGFVVGLAHDAVAGGLFGLYGFAKTLVGYLAGVAAQRFMVQQPLPALLVFAVAAAAQEVAVTGLVLVLYARPEIPAPVWLLVKVATTALLGVGLYVARARLAGRHAAWRRSRSSRLRLD